MRGSTSPPDELAYILRHSGAVALICQDAQALEKLLPALAQYDAQHAAGSGEVGAKGASANGAGAARASANGAGANGAGGESAAPGVRRRPRENALSCSRVFASQCLMDQDLMGMSGLLTRQRWQCSTLWGERAVTHTMQAGCKWSVMPCTCLSATFCLRKMCHPFTWLGLVALQCVCWACARRACALQRCCGAA